MASNIWAEFEEVKPQKNDIWAEFEEVAQPVQNVQPKKTIQPQTQIKPVTQQPVQETITPIEQEQPQEQQEITTQQPLQASVEVKRIPNWDKKGRIYYTDEFGNKIKDGLNPLEKVGRKAKAFTTNLSRSINNPTPEELKNRQKTAFFLESLALNPTSLLGLGAIAGANTAFDNYVDTGKINPVQVGANTALAIGGGYGLQKGLPWLAKTKVGRAAGEKAMEGIDYIGEQIGRKQRYKYLKAKRQERQLQNKVQNEQKLQELESQRQPNIIQEVRKEPVINEEIAQSVTPKQLNLFEQAEQPIIKQAEKTTPKATQINEQGLIEKIPVGRTKKRGATETVRKYYGDDVANQITDTDYAIRGRKVLENEYNNATPEMKQALLETDNLDDLAVYAKAQFIKDNIAQGNIPTAQLNKWVKEGTKQGQAFQVRQFLAPNTVEGAAVQAQNYILNAQPKNVQKIVESIPDIVKNVQKQLTPEQKLKEINKMLKNKVMSKAKRKTLADKILRLEELGGLNEQYLTELINKEFKIKELNADNIKRFEELTANIRNATGYDNDVAVQRLSKYITSLQPASKMKKLKTVRNIAMLLNPKTLGRNIVGNVIFNAVDTGAKALAVPFDRAIGLFTGQKTRVAPQIGTSFRGGAQGAVRGAKEAWEGIDTRGLGQRFDLGQGRVFENPIGQGFETALDVGLRVPDRMTYEGAYAESVVNQMLASGDITKKELNALYANKVPLDDILAKAPQEILERADKEALEAVFQNNSYLSEFFQGARNLDKMVYKKLTGNTLDFGIGDLFNPYVQTPSNLTQQAINYSPLGYIKSAWNLARGDQRQAALDMSRATIGSGLIGGGYALSNADIITPSQFADNYTENRRMKENLELLGIRPDQIGNYTYSFAQPMSTTLAAGAAMGRGENPYRAAFNTITDMPFMQNTSNFIKDAADQDVPYAIGRFVSSVPSQFVPQLSSQFAQYNDPYMRETYDPNMFKQGLNQAINKIPGETIGRKRLPIKYNVKGQPKMTTAVNEHPVFDTFFNPTFVNEHKDDPVVQEALRLQESTGKNTLLDVPDKKYKKRKLTSEEYSQYSQKLGEKTYKMLNVLQKMPIYQEAIDDEERANLTDMIKKLAKSSTQSQILETDKERLEELLKDELKYYKDKEQQERKKEVKEIMEIMAETL